MIGIGIDVVEVQRFRGALERWPRLVERVFTLAEVESISDRSDPVPGLAARFAAKEATMKALGVGLFDIGFLEIEITRKGSGAPSLSVSGRARRRADVLSVEELHLSMTHTQLIASAVVAVDGSR
ncbi:MAG TPA: holo-ACP synthase [Acidimicrobiales bacterium]|nr:holo-ACP synthase [Acidimicrobiales bacterium]